MKRIVVSITAASGAIYGIRLLEALAREDVEIHLVISEWASRVIELETSYSVKDVEKLAHRNYQIDDLSAPISSGSFMVQAMVVIPCSMKTLGSVACGYADNLISRAADISIKEGRKLIIVPRETPLNAIHLENMLKLSRLGVVILPPMPAFYTEPSSLDDLINHTVGKVLDQLGIENSLYKRWKQ